MLKPLAKTVASLSLILSASVAEPAWSASKDRSKAKCPYAKHEAAKAKMVAAAQPARGGALVEKRKLDIQILSFGP